MERGRPIQALADVLLIAGLSTALTNCDIPLPHTSPDDAYLRDSVLSSHHIRPEAQALLDTVPFVDKHTTKNGGGITFSSPVSVVVYSPQPEATLHEFSHAWFNLTINNDNAFCTGFEEAVKEVADNPDDDPYYKVLYYGDNKNFKGLKNNCNETYASISSYSMGEKNRVPESIQPFYKTLYTWNDQAK